MPDNQINQQIDVEHETVRKRGRPKKDALPPARSKTTKKRKRKSRKKSKTPHKQRRFNRGTFPPYSQAKQLARTLSGAKSRKQYYDWHKDNNIMFIPYDPPKVYKNEWESWNEWLGTTNYFEQQSPKQLIGKENIIIPFFEAARWAHSLGFNYIREWKEYLDNGGYIPYGIPRHPDYWYVKYGTWYGWPVFLGKGEQNNVYRMQVHNKFVEHHRRIFLLWDKTNHSNDTFVIAYGGSLEHAKFIAQKNISILGVYKCNRSDQKDIVTPLINYYSIPYDEDNKHIRITTKWHDLKWQLDNALLIIDKVYNSENMSQEK